MWYNTNLRYKNENKEKREVKKTKASFVKPGSGFGNFKVVSSKGYKIKSSATFRNQGRKK